MKPIGPLMREHRLIERMIALMGREIEQINASGKVNTGFLMVAVDFIRTYADRTHHGKEEDILFRSIACLILILDNGLLLLFVQVRAMIVLLRRRSIGVWIQA